MRAVCVCVSALLNPFSYYYNKDDYNNDMMMIMIININNNNHCGRFYTPPFGS